ncbi:hypothetical protein R3P38DRAFT_3341989 [Favolaschia claudopus]|uniref:Uncharacterized protein n=1 Tax=Favolaschia claudopus TaxID=2862362 RepID=A0AAW0E0W0_9AGAR
MAETTPTPELRSGANPTKRVQIVEEAMADRKGKGPELPRRSSGHHRPSVAPHEIFGGGPHTSIAPGGQHPDQERPYPQPNSTFASAIPDFITPLNYNRFADALAAPNAFSTPPMDPLAVRWDAQSHRTTHLINQCLSRTHFMLQCLQECSEFLSVEGCCRNCGRLAEIFTDLLAMPQFHSQHHKCGPMTSCDEEEWHEKHAKTVDKLIHVLNDFLEELTLNKHQTPTLQTQLQRFVNEFENVRLETQYSWLKLSIRSHRTEINDHEQALKKIAQEFAAQQATIDTLKRRRDSLLRQFADNQKARTPQPVAAKA